MKLSLVRRDADALQGPDMLDSTVILPFDIAQAEYSVHLHYRGRWVRAATTACLDSAEEMAEQAHRRSNLAVEIRNADGCVVTAFDPPAIGHPFGWSGVALR